MPYYLDGGDAPSCPGSLAMRRRIRSRQFRRDGTIDEPTRVTFPNRARRPSWLLAQISTTRTLSQISVVDARDERSQAGIEGTGLARPEGQGRGRPATVTDQSQRNGLKELSFNDLSLFQPGWTRARRVRTGGPMIRTGWSAIADPTGVGNADGSNPTGQP